MWKEITLISLLGIASAFVLFKSKKDKAASFKGKSENLELTDPPSNVVEVSPKKSAEITKTPTSEDYDWSNHKSSKTLNDSLDYWSSEAVGDWSSAPPPKQSQSTKMKVNKKERSASSSSFKGKVRCKYWPDCRFKLSVFQTTRQNDSTNSSLCEYWHPDTKCQHNDKCHYANHCMFWHDKDLLIENRPYAFLKHLDKINMNGYAEHSSFKEARL